MVQTLDQAVVFGTLVGAFVLFIHGRIRYDIVALLALFMVTLTGIVGWDQAFSGFSSPAVITVAAVLVITRGLQNAGLVELITRGISRVGNRTTMQVFALTGLSTAFSGFMNNVGALALLMPVSIRQAKKSGTPPSVLLLPLAFGSCLGGLITLIGTPPNIVIASSRAQYSGVPFTMFDFTPVGLGVAFAGFLFIVLIGWRLVPRRPGPGSPEDLFDIKDYLTEVRVTGTSKFATATLRNLEEMAATDVTVIGVVRGDSVLPSFYGDVVIRQDDILIIRADSGDLKTFLDTTGFTLVESGDAKKERLFPWDVTLMEATVMPDSPVIGRTVRETDIGRRFGVFVLAVARQGERLQERLHGIHFHAGDVLLLQGTPGTLQETVKALGCLPLAERGLKIGEPRKVMLAVGIFGLAILIAALGLVPVQIIFLIAAVTMVLLSLVPLREIYGSIDWPVIILIGALIPVGQALESSGGARVIASLLLELQVYLPAIALLVLIVGVTMLISNIINNTATAVLMAPIAISLAGGLGVSADSFLMAVAIGASTPFLTPIGHHSNALVMGPAGLRFGDYWKLGLPLSILVIAVAVPLIVFFWPL